MIPLNCIAHPYCWFASDVTAAMLGVKNKSVSFRWEMNSILMQILPKISFVLTMAALSRGCKPRLAHNFLRHSARTLRTKRISYKDKLAGEINGNSFLNEHGDPPFLMHKFK